jgi:hypothetical protein
VASCPMSLGFCTTHLFFITCPRKEFLRVAKSFNLGRWAGVDDKSRRDTGVWPSLGGTPEFGPQSRRDIRQ